MSLPTTFATERLLLRPTALEDADFILALMNTPGWLKYIGDRDVRTLAAARDYIRIKMLSQQERLGYGNFTVVRAADGARLGTCGLYDREALEGVDIGFAFLPEYTGQGYAYEAARQVMTAGVEDYGLRHIVGITTPDNKPSQRLLEKLGLQYTQEVELPDDPVTLWLYEWRADKQAT
ncbi:MAG: GNAT family N-acetyltransferase [Lewinella sp.]|nr:GNAT family N-acetyltransferase [Lewinella sp.]